MLDRNMSVDGCTSQPPANNNKHKLNEKAFKHLENTVNGPVNYFSERTPRPPACSLRGLKAACEGALVGHAENNTIQRVWVLKPFREQVSSVQM